ncbi:Predicted Fe-Mo cluster-binding protein, NifX family [Maridesulfovibrio ferrireducens]|uniref:Predicted Fe-Mo cluster-binding protein, NifX family n=1 Tax=Maridesulfovibrio ferrireducens TaxID=246191 RepID=A0A1G9ECQ0_9BACT|nr:NifB/NifX family molybdenum-iron cluster-binding protein [Maridesulfovibrio ferrireducens]SDK73950.1 Predicted Fe-Mo cluster-binding protein, NifX family [Maridesulfovibrio ferrireducens]
MLIAISTNGSDLDSPLEPRFGRATGFIVYDTDSENHSFVDNSANSTLPQGAGIQTAELLAGKGVNVVISGTVGPKATQALNRGGIQTMAVSGGTVRDVLEKYKIDQSGGVSPESVSTDKQPVGSQQQKTGCRRMGGTGMGRGQGGGGRGGGQGGQGRR